MYKKVFEACCKYNLGQAKKIKDNFNLRGLNGSSVESYAFTITSLNAFYNKPHSLEQLKDIITDCDHDGGIDSFVFTNDSVDIFDLKSSENLGLREIQNLENRLKELVFSEYMPNPIDEDWKALEKPLKICHSVKNTRGQVNIIIIRKKFAKLNKSIEAVIRRIESHDGVKVVRLNEKQLIDKMLDLNLLSEWLIPKKNIKILHTQPEETKSNGDYNVLIIKLPLIEILNLYKKHKVQKKDLFAKNIRIPKKMPKFSAGLEDTLKKNNNEFHLFHNGITIVTSGITSDRVNYYISEPQVVNGAQTIENIYLIYENKKNNSLFKNSSIICKIVKADQDTTNRICETSNTQKAVKIEDLRTNDSFQKELEIYIKNESKNCYEYSRKGAKITTKNAKKIKYTTFFQWVYASMKGKPAAAKNSKRILFETDGRGEYEEIQRLIVKNIKQVVVLCDLGTFVEEKIRNMKTTTLYSKSEKGLAKDMNLHIIAGLYLLQLKEGKPIDKDINFENTFDTLKNLFEKENKKDPSLDSGRFFTKFETARDHLKLN